MKKVFIFVHCLLKIRLCVCYRVYIFYHPRTSRKALTVLCKFFLDKLQTYCHNIENTLLKNYIPFSNAMNGKIYLPFLLEM